MKTFDVIQLNSSVAGIHVKLDNIERLLLAQSNNPQPASPSHPEREYLNSVVELASFLGCSYTTAKRLKRARHIKFMQEGTRVKFYIPDVIDAINNDNRVSGLVSKMWEKLFNQGAAEKSKVRPKVFIEAELHGRFIFIGLRYQGWSCTACCSAELWEKPKQVRDLVNQIILAQNNRKPFKISPL